MRHKPEVRQYYVRQASGSSLRLREEFGEPEVRVGGVEKRMPPDTIPVDGEVRGFDAKFCSVGRAGIDDYGWMYAEGWLREGAGANFLLKGHDWQDMPAGAGRVVRMGDDLHLMGKFRAAATGSLEYPGDLDILNFFRMYNTAVEHGVSLEVSMGFFVGEYRESTDEEYEMGAEVVITKGDLVEVSYVFRGAVPNTALSLRSGELSEEREIGARIKKSELFDGADEQLHWLTHRQRMENY